MLAEGEIDALYTPRVPSPPAAGNRRVRRLFGDTVGAEKQHYEQTGIFPIMQVVAIRREVYERHRWVAQSLYKALLLAHFEAMASLYDTSALRFMLPWLIQELEQPRALMGEDFWSHGVEGDFEVLATFLRYHHEQGLSRRRFELEELFAPETLEAGAI
jgi:hypothetical protein